MPLVPLVCIKEKKVSTWGNVKDIWGHTHTHVPKREKVWERRRGGIDQCDLGQGKEKADGFVPSLLS